MLPFPELWPRLLELAPRVPAAEMPLEAAAGRVLAADAVAAWDLPRFANSAMDGFAVRAADAAAGTTLRLVGMAYAGVGDPPAVAPGTAVPIGTGGVLPPGADAVVPKENAAADGSELRVEQAPAPGDNVRGRGEEVAAGGLVVPAGTRLTVYAIAALQAAGVTRIRATRAPVVRVLATGNELVPPGRAPGPGEIVETNGQLLSRGIARMLDIQVPPAERVPDTETDLAAAMARALDGADLVVTTGGVSVGDRDLVKPIAAQLGVEEALWKVAMKPGKPIYVGRRGETVLVGLPGNPAPVGVGLPVVLAPLLAAMEGAADALPVPLPLPLAEPVRPNRSRHHLRWSRIVTGNGGIPAVAPLPLSGSHMLSSLARADVLAILPPGQAELAAGTPVPTLPLPRV